MIQKFRWRFITISVCSLLIVLLVSIGGLVGISFYHNHNEANRVMTALVKNDGTLNPNASKQIDGGVPNRFINGKPNPESAYQYRYFRVVINKKQVILTNQPKNFTWSQSKINSQVKSILASGKKDGRIRFNNNVYSYHCYRSQTGQQAIIFLNISLIYAHSWSLLRLGIILGLCSLIFFALILIGLSKKAIKPIIETYHKQQQFITNAGHELKTPLTIISANTEMQEMTGQASEWTESTKEQTKRLTQLIDHLIAIARTGETGELTLSPVDLSGIVQKAGTSFKPVMEKQGLQFITNVQPNLTVLAEEKSLTELINIFLDNAQKYCDPKGQVQIDLAPSKLSNSAVLKISNTYQAGKGQNFNQFFDRFYRADESHNQKRQGFGIGLSMAQELVHAFRGKIKVDYREPMIIFTIVLKLAK
ncbi:MAG: HAMP domain-containing histidine kinase [Lactobacillus sp.]|jgi:signal transduction histidine kinase|nr:HAMP domain-containing histidine kinase [Lactobacillus sp.]MCH3906332.1 HAMP domain-containing histidine kinase [Lactobacillus sp.]MCH3990094.1 HAMP domain-containing histidine kinase [Lactobacillus sp.]MCH4069192.1 HAMP domain-containing histidine kinase [Lactobacillus sp.]MCI1303494.1 HAMP domain-containing histidine kinase [Lactobacillus sp.]